MTAKSENRITLYCSKCKADLCSVVYPDLPAGGNITLENHKAFCCDDCAPRDAREEIRVSYLCAVCSTTMEVAADSLPPTICIRCRSRHFSVLSRVGPPS